MRRLAAAALCGAVVVIAGCAERTLEPESAELAEPTTVSAQRYLADSAGAAASLREFVGILDEAGPEVTDAEARRIAPDLERLAAEFTARAGRIERERLEDQRLEVQRAEISALLVPAVAGVQAAALAAEDGDAAALSAAADELRGQISQLIEAGNT